MKRIVWTILGILLFAGMIYGLYVSPLFRIHSIEFNSAYDMDLDTVFVYTGLEEGMSYFEVDAERVREGLLSHPFVKDATVTKQFPNHVIIDIIYREHFVTLSYLDVMISIDEEMVVLGVLNKYDKGYRILGLPFETYSAGRTIDIVKLYVLKNIIDYMKLFELAKIDPEKNIRFEDNCILFEVEGITVNFGLGENCEKRFNDFVVIYNDLKSKGVDGGVINISSDGAPVYQPFGN